MPKCAANELRSGHLGRRVIEANFNGGALSSNGGVMLVRQVEAHRLIGVDRLSAARPARSGAHYALDAHADRAVPVWIGVQL